VFIRYSSTKAQPKLRLQICQTSTWLRCARAGRSRQVSGEGGDSNEIDFVCRCRDCRGCLRLNVFCRRNDAAGLGWRAQGDGGARPRAAGCLAGRRLARRISGRGLEGRGLAPSCVAGLRRAPLWLAPSCVAGIRVAPLWLAPSSVAPCLSPRILRRRLRLWRLWVWWLRLLLRRCAAPPATSWGPTSSREMSCSCREEGLDLSDYCSPGAGGGTPRANFGRARRMSRRLKLAPHWRISRDSGRPRTVTRLTRGVVTLCIGQGIALAIETCIESGREKESCHAARQDPFRRLTLMRHIPSCKHCRRWRSIPQTHRFPRTPVRRASTVDPSPDFDAGISRISGSRPNASSQMLIVLDRPASRRVERALLILQQLGMHERQIKKLPQCFFGCLSKLTGNRSVSHGARERVGSKRANTNTKHVTGKLVEEDHKAKCTLRVCFPNCEFTGSCSLVRRQKFRRDDPIEVVVLFEPPRRARRASEGYDLSSSVGVFRRVHSSMRLASQPGLASDNVSSC
jgi:hypothetical protein